MTFKKSCEKTNALVQIASNRSWEGVVCIVWSWESFHISMVLWTVDQWWNSIIILNTINNRFPSWEILFYSIRSRNLFPGLHLFSRHLLLGNFFNFNFIFSSWHHLLAFCQDHLYVTWRTHVRWNQQGKQHIKLPHCCNYSLRSRRILVARVLSGSRATPKERRSCKGKSHLPHFFWVLNATQISNWLVPTLLPAPLLKQYDTPTLQ